MKYLICLFIILLTKHVSLAQNKDDSVATNANSMVKKYFKDLDRQDYLLFHVDDFYLVIIRKKNDYIKYVINDYRKNIDSAFVSRKDKKLLKNIFSKELSPFNFIYFEKDSLMKFYRYSRVRFRPNQFNYFLLKKKGIKYVEYNIPIWFVNNDPKIHIYPIRAEGVGFLFLEWAEWLQFKYSQENDNY